jgi:hypothetical protein
MVLRFEAHKMMWLRNGKLDSLQMRGFLRRSQEDITILDCAGRDTRLVIAPGDAEIRRATLAYDITMLISV